MGYLCPVCEEPFASSQGCANHLAVTAILHGDAHEVWLDETVEKHAENLTDWESIPRAELAALVADHAAETEEHDHPGEHTHPVDQSVSGPLDQPAVTASPAAVEDLDADARAILREARELTERMRERGPDEGKQS